MDAHDEPNITNNMAPRTHECIALRPNGKMQGTQKVFCMKSGRGMKITNITPMTAMYKIIKIVDDWGEKPRIDHYGKAI